MSIMLHKSDDACPTQLFTDNHTLQGSTATTIMSGAESSAASRHSIVSGNSYLSWDESRESTEFDPNSRSARRSLEYHTQASNETPPPPQQKQQQQQSYSTPQSSPPINRQPAKRSVSQESFDAIMTPHSPTPFRFMQPREFSLGSNLKRVHPSMPLPTLPANISSAPSKKAVANKDKSKPQKEQQMHDTKNERDSLAYANKCKLKAQYAPRSNKSQNERDKFAHVVTAPTEYDPPKRASMCSIAMSSLTMGRISEEGSRCSSGISSAFSATLCAMDDEDASGNEIDEEFEETTTEQSQAMVSSHGSENNIAKKNSFQTQNYNMGVVAMSLAEDLLKVSSVELGNVNDALDKPKPALIDIIADEDQSCSDDESSSGSSFLTWDQSRASHAYILAMKKDSPDHDEQPQHEQHEISFPQPQQEKEQGLMQTNSYHSQMSPPQHQQQQPSYPTQQQQQPANPPPYNRSASQETCDTISSHSPTPFRPMLPRELLLGNNLRRLNPELPFPILPADVSGMSSSAKKRRGGGSAGREVAPGPRSATPQEEAPQITHQSVFSA